MTGVKEDDVFKLLEVDSYFRLVKSGQPKSQTDVLDKLRLDRLIERDTGNRVTISNFGAILLANRLDDFESTSRKIIRVVQYEGVSHTKIIKETPGRRGYAVGFEGLIKFLKSILPQAEGFETGLRKTKYAYDEEMLREAVANALIHQDFAIGGTGPMIDVFKDRVEIANPGRPLIDPARFIDMPPRSRNERLAAMMRRMDVCEERGTGVDKIISAAERDTLPAPDFRVDGENSKTILCGPRKFRETSPSERVRACYQHSVMRFIQGERMTNSSLRYRLGVDERNAAQVSRVIGEALEGRHIKQADSWSTRAGSYVPIWA